MNRIAVALCALLIFGATGGAQQISDFHQRTAAPSNARFEIVQSELAAKWTFRLDRFTGHVAQLVKAKSGEDAWEAMEVIGLPHVSSPMRARFQIFASGLAAKFTFLIDTDTGKTWVLVSSKGNNPDGTEYDINTWEPFAEEN
jgi:hypothetical protein